MDSISDTFSLFHSDLPLEYVDKLLLFYQLPSTPLPSQLVRAKLDALLAICPSMNF